MDVIALSDLHGYLPKIESDFDLMLIPGDICPVWNHHREFQFNWLKSDFSEWVKNLPFKNEYSKVVFCGGNHDLVLESISKSKINEILDQLDGRLVYLDNEEYVFKCPVDGEMKEYRIFATPYCKKFGNWAFMRDAKKLEQYYSFIPDGLDFLMSHDSPDFPPIGVITEGAHKGVQAGNPQLAKAIFDKKPKWCIFGHIHSGTHECRVIDGTVLSNVALLNEDYEPTYPILTINYQK